MTSFPFMKRKPMPAAETSMHAAAPAFAEEYVHPTSPAGFVPVKRPEGATEESLRGIYPLDGKLLGPSANCRNCYKSGYVIVDGKEQYCPCQFDQIIWAKAQKASAS
jgi:hypothetical protein